MVSVIIPAHNEASVIGRGLSALLDGAQPGELDIVVVCNGCNDDTAAIAKRYGGAVRVLETPVASKIAALNLGDVAANSFPRVYLDADVVLTIGSLRQIIKPLDEEHSVLAAGPVPRFDTTGCSWAVRSFFAVNRLLPSSREGIGGSGAYVLSAKGRTRFLNFPDVTADDGFARILFAPQERVSVAAAECIVFAPRRLSDLISIKTRSHFGNYELAHRYPHLQTNRGEGNGRVLFRLFLQPTLWPALAVYGCVKLQARRLAKRRMRELGGAPRVWSRDESSREAAVHAPTTRQC